MNPYKNPSVGNQVCDIPFFSAGLLLNCFNVTLNFSITQNLSLEISRVSCLIWIFCVIIFPRWESPILFEGVCLRRFARKSENTWDISGVEGELAKLIFLTGPSKSMQDYFLAMSPSLKCFCVPTFDYSESRKLENHIFQ